MRETSAFKLMMLGLLLALLSPLPVSAGEYEDAVAALTDGEYRQAYRGFKRLAQRDHVEAQYQVGMLYLFGQGAKLDTEQGIHWLERAANNGSYAAANELAQIYISGRGVPPNEAEAIKWMELATTIAEQDESVADDGCE
jgi:TPR repeat protein